MASRFVVIIWAGVSTGHQGAESEGLHAGPELPFSGLSDMTTNNRTWRLAEATVGVFLGILQGMTIIKTHPAGGELGLLSSLGAQDERTRVSSVNRQGGYSTVPQLEPFGILYVCALTPRPLSYFLQVTQTLGCWLGNFTQAATASVALRSNWMAVFIPAQFVCSFY